MREPAQGDDVLVDVSGEHLEDVLSGWPESSWEKDLWIEIPIGDFRVATKCNASHCGGSQKPFVTMRIWRWRGSEPVAVGVFYPCPPARVVQHTSNLAKPAE